MKWDSHLYDEKHQFVAAYGKNLLQAISPDPAQRILDLGCGTGTLTAQLKPLCGYVLGVDSSPDMIRRAHRQYPQLDFQVADALSLPWQEAWNIVFSNAVFHWIKDHNRLLANVRRCLKPGGQLICEFGAQGNVAAIEAAFSQAAADAGYAYRSKFTFPSPGQFGALLEQNGFVIDHLFDYDRPTPLLDGRAGLDAWVKQFFASELEAIPTRLHPMLFHRIQELLLDQLWDGHQWFADYRRLQTVAHIPCG